MKNCAVRKWRAPTVVLLVSSLAALPLVAHAQSGPGKSPASAKTAPAAKAWTISHTPDGQPDLQGTWVNFDPTPFEKPLPGEIASRSPVISFTDQKPRVSQRPSMIVDPPDGQLPPVTAWAAQQRDYRKAHVQDSWEYWTSWERCITRGVPGGMFPVVYNNAHQIFQTPGYVVILTETIHETRIIPIDGRPHLPESIRQWNGNPRGHWEGNTLVVETTNFNGKGMFAEYGPLQYVPESEAATIIEHFTRINADTINYEVTVRDPVSFTAPWTVAMPLTRDDSYRMFEYACHEGNRNYMEITLGAGRAQEKSVKDKAAEGKAAEDKQAEEPAEKK